MGPGLENMVDEAIELFFHLRENSSQWWSCAKEHYHEEV